jgi:hypothetical protein
MDYVPALTSFSFRVADENWRALVSYRVVIEKDGQIFRRSTGADR